MQSRRDLLATGAVAGGALLLAPWPARAAAGHVRSATAITQVFGDGQKLTAVAIEYDRPVDGAKLSAAAFRVEGRTVTDVYTASTADPGARAQAGAHVIVALSPDDPSASLREGGMGPGGPPGAADGPPRPGPGGGSGPMSGPPRDMPAPTYRRAQAAVVQVAALASVDGRSLPPPAAPITTSAVRNLVVDDFRQLEFRDPATGDLLRYNLFVPKGYDKGRSYPLVLFMHDAGATSADPLTTLRQGLGAVIWASPAEQAKHPCFVLAPQFSRQVVNDASEATSELDTTVHLIEQLAREYGVDRARLYTTGQSGGAMMSIAMDIKYPDLFAASFIVAGQWDAALVKPLAQDRLWIVVAEGDLKAYPGQNAITAKLEQEGAKVSRAVWDGRSTPSQFAAAVSAMEAKRNPINYVALRKGTVVPAGQSDNGGGNHVNTWRIAYTIEGIRDWLFRQHR